MIGLAVLVPDDGASVQSDLPRGVPSTEPAVPARGYPVRGESTMTITVPLVAGESADEQLKLSEVVNEPRSSGSRPGQRSRAPRLLMIFEEGGEQP